MEIREYFNIVWKRKLIIVLCFIVAAFAGVIINYGFLPVKYAAAAKVLVEPRAKTIIFMSDQMRNMPPALDIETYVKVIKSLKVGKKAAEILGEKDIDSAAAGLTSQVQVAAEEDTGIVRIGVEGANPKTITRLANAYASASVYVCARMVDETNQEVKNYIEQQLVKAREEEMKLAVLISDFKTKHGIVDPTDEASRQEEAIRTLQGERLQAEIAAEDTRVRFEQFEQMLQRYKESLKRPSGLKMGYSTSGYFGGNKDAAPGGGAGINNKGVGNGGSANNENFDTSKKIEETIAALEMDKVLLEQKYAPSHPKIKSIIAQIRMLESRKKNEIDALLNDSKVSEEKFTSVRDRVADLGVENALAQARIKQILRSLDSAEEKKKIYPTLEYELGKLTRQHQMAETFVDMLTKQQLENEVQKAQQPTNVRSLDNALEPTEPISPQRKKNIGIIMIFGFIAGLGIAFLLEEMEESIRTSDDVKNYLNLPVLGSIPYSTETINKLITDVPLKSPIAEAYRRLSFFTQLFCLDPPIKSLLITSSKSDEGKSTTLANMAISMAQEGTKVLIVDTDLRRPMLHRMFGVDNSLGLSSILTGELEAEIAVSDLVSSGRLPKESFMDVVVDRIIQPSPFKGLGIIPSGPLPANSIELLRSERMLSFLRTIEKKADIILFDSPPAIHVIDAVVLSQILDGVLLVINSGRINREEALQVKYMVESTKTPIIGVALNNIEAASPDYYYYYYYGGYGYGSRQRRKRVKLKR